MSQTSVLAVSKYCGFKMWLHLSLIFSMADVCFGDIAAVRERCIQAGLVTALVPLLNSSNQELLLHTGRAIGRICFDNSEHSCSWANSLLFRSGQRQAFTADKQIPNTFYIANVICSILSCTWFLSCYLSPLIFFPTDLSNILFSSCLCIPPSAVQQTQLVKSGVIPRLVAIMRQYPENDPLVNVCLLALCNLADMGEKHSRCTDLNRLTWSCSPLIYTYYCYCSWWAINGLPA